MNSWIRQIHRWMSIAFTLTVIANFVALGMKTQIDLVTYSPLLPLFVLLFMPTPWAYYPPAAEPDPAAAAGPPPARAQAFSSNLARSASHTTGGT